MNNGNYSCVYPLQGALNLARNLGLSMPDVPHEELVALLLDAWECVVFKTGNTRKQMYRKVRGNLCMHGHRHNRVNLREIVCRDRHYV